MREEARKKARERAKELVEQMTIDEVISQLSYNAPAIDRLGIPEYNWWNEGLHGVARAGTATIFPQAIGMAATWNEKILKEVGKAVATEARAKYNESKRHGDRDIYKGLTLWTPNINIFRDPRWGRGHETLGEDPYLTSKLAVEEIKGLQGDGEYLKVAACAKHFAVHSGPEAVRHSFDAKTSKKDMRETYLPAFKAAVCEANVEAVMGAYNRTNGEPCCAHSELIGDILRGEWGFEGHFVSDCWAIRDFHEHHGVTKNGVQSSALALNKGCDLNCGCSYLCLKEALNKQLVKKSDLKQAAIRLFTTRFLLGMFDENEFDKISYLEVESKKHLNLAREVAEESIVLLKNDGILPLKKEEIKTIGVIGPNANSRRSLDGNYHGTASRYITALEGIQDYVGEGIRVMYSVGCELSSEKSEVLSAKPYDRISEALSVADYSDVIVLCLGLDETLEGEEGDIGNAYFSGDKRDLLLPKPQQILLDALLNLNKPIIVSIFSGSAMDLRIAQNANALLQTWYPGAMGGKAFANIIFGEVSPSGKLPITIYKDTDCLPDFEDYSMENRTYRYLKDEPLFPFGFGLNYGDTCLEAVDILDESPDRSRGLNLRVEISNRGRATKDVVQVYVKNDSKYAALNPTLVEFEKIAISSGERAIIELKINEDAFKVVDNEGQLITDGKSSKIYIGLSAPDDLSERLTGKKCKCIDVDWII
jgi:beta-xylosidase xyl3A